METRRIRGDQIEVFKITHEIEGLDSGMFFNYRTDNRTREYSWALAKERCKLDIRKYAFSQRTINEWNRLPGECINATSVNMFEKTIVQSKISRSPILFLGTRKLDDFQDRQPTDFLPPRKILTNQREVQYRKHHRRLQAAMDASGADKLILLVQTNQVL